MLSKNNLKKIKLFMAINCFKKKLKKPMNSAVDSRYIPNDHPVAYIAMILGMLPMVAS